MTRSRRKHYTRAEPTGEGRPQRRPRTARKEPRPREGPRKLGGPRKPGAKERAKDNGGSRRSKKPRKPRKPRRPKKPRRAKEATAGAVQGSTTTRKISVCKRQGYTSEWSAGKLTQQKHALGSKQLESTRHSGSGAHAFSTWAPPSSCSSGSSGGSTFRPSSSRPPLSSHSTRRGCKGKAARIIAALRCWMAIVISWRQRPRNSEAASSPLRAL